MKHKCKSKFKVEYEKKMIGQGFIGMNYYAAKELKVPFHHKHRGVVEIYKKMSPTERRKTIKHEEIEYTMMEKKHLKYKPAHLIATYYEKKPGRVVNILKQIENKKR
jgi:hypothetical protein